MVAKSDLLRIGVGVLSVVAAGCLGGCSAGAVDSETPDSESADIVSCTAQSKSDAKSHYDRALDLAKKRAAKKVCESDAYQSTIEEEASLAASLCKDYEGAIKSRAAAAPIRDALKESLMLGYVTGIVRPSGAWRGLRDALPGVTLYGPAPGVFGTTFEVKFLADAKVTVRRLDTGDVPKWIETPGTYALGAPSATSIAITVKEATGTFTLTLSTERIGTSDARRITVTPGKTNLPAGFYATFPSECEA